mgnify:CR=1 FL=1
MKVSKLQGHFIDMFIIYYLEYSKNWVDYRLMRYKLFKTNSSSANNV